MPFTFTRFVAASSHDRDYGDDEPDDFSAYEPEEEEGLGGGRMETLEDEAAEDYAEEVSEPAAPARSEPPRPATPARRGARRPRSHLLKTSRHPSAGGGRSSRPKKLRKAKKAGQRAAPSRTFTKDVAASFKKKARPARARKAKRAMRRARRKK